jgi:enoyl-CoA hydratase
MSNRILLEISGDVASLVLVPPDERKPPTLDHGVLDEMEAHLAALAARSEIRLVVVRSRSPKFFCVGANINVLATLDPVSIVPWVEHGHRVMNALESLPCPVVARVEGYALGGGLELAMAADMIFASDTAQFGQPEAKLGVVPGWGGTWRLPRRVGVARAKELSFSGRMVTATEAVKIGLAEFCGTSAELEAHCEGFARDLRACTPLAIREIKQLLDSSLDLPREQGGPAEAKASVVCLRSPETQAQIATFTQRRK